MNTYKELIKFIKDYINSAYNVKQTIAFCDQYMEAFDNIRESSLNLPSDKFYELLDDIYMECDAFEPNNLIREGDIHCIDEQQLRERIQKYLFSILNLY